MTAIALDLRGPVIVVAGAFNPAIFTQSWVATNVFDVPEGAEITILEALIQVESDNFLRLAFINGVAANVSASRLDLFAVDRQPATLAAVEAALTRILELLPHTPVRAIGCNFRWSDTDPTSEATDRFDSPEGFEGRFEVRSRQFTVQLAIDDGVLNFTRANAGSDVLYSFNYHRTVADGVACAALVNGMVGRDLEHSTELMRTLYGYDEHTTLSFTSVQQGELNDATEAAI